MDKQKEKALVSEAEVFLQKLIDENNLTIPDIQTLIKKLQKVNSQNNKKIIEDKKDLSKYIENKIELKEFLEKDEKNYLILAKACQKILSKSQPQPQPTQDNSEKKSETKKSPSLFKFDKKEKDVIGLFDEGDNYFKENSDNLFVYFENLSKLKLELNEMPFFTMTYFPKDKKINFYLKNKGKMNLTFAQVDYLCNDGTKIFLNIDYYLMMENCEVDKCRDYKENCIDMAQFEKKVKDIPVLKGNEIKISYVDNGYEQFKKDLKEYFDTIKDQVKCVVTDNREYFNKIFD